MAYIETGVNHPGIVELLFYKGSTGKALSALIQTLIYGPSGLSSGERELIASYTSKLNDCDFCHNSHGEAASVHLGDNGKALSCILEDIDTAPISDKMKALLKIAGKVQISGKAVTEEHVENARKAGATDEDVHDAVLIASAFCMYNRYVDGMGTEPAKKEEYPGMGEMLAKVGYRYPPKFLRKYVIRKINKSRENK